ncbi:MAG: Gfo/Idh/MocA family oxidoreductase [Planctomycetales bacterium]
MPITRREFLQRGSAASMVAFGTPWIVPAAALGREGPTAPSERIHLGVIGAGARGRLLIDRFAKEKDAHVVAVCDVDRSHLNAAQDAVDQAHGRGSCRGYRDFRELIACSDIDAVVVATPDHWHALISIAAAEAGKDIYCEKPLANTVAEGRAIVQAVRRARRILQVGSHERSNANCRRACELVRSGSIGELRTIRVNLPDDEPHHAKVKRIDSVPEPIDVPEGFDYDFWLGHTPVVPFTPGRCHFRWRFNLRYGGGEMTDRGAHVIDIAQLGAGMDHTTPVHFEARGTRDPQSLYDVFWDYGFVNTYENGLKLVGSTQGPRGVKFEGSDGWIFVHIHGGRLEAEPKSVLQRELGPGDVHLGRSPGHQRDFLDAIKTRKEPMAPVEVGYHTATICHLNNIAMLVGESLRFDPTSGQITNSELANRLLSPTMRPPWTL